MFRITIDVDRYRMAVTIESAVERSILVHGCRLICSDVGSKSSIHPILALGIVNHFSERVPVCTGTDNKYRILLSGIAVANCHRTSIILTCPCSAFIELGVDMVGGKETIFDSS